MVSIFLAHFFFFVLVQRLTTENKDNDNDEKCERRQGNKILTQMINYSVLSFLLETMIKGIKKEKRTILAYFPVSRVCSSIVTALC